MNYLIKKCTRCNIEKINNNFRKDIKWKLWTRSICKECESEYLSNRYNNNKKYILLQQKEYYNTSENRRYTKKLDRAKRRAVINSMSDNSITIIFLKNLLEKQNNKCNYCWKNISEHTSRHLDHIIPLSKWWIHSISNVQWLCCRCNLKKWSKIFAFY